MHTTPRSLRLQIGLFGRRNSGKSSLLNALCGQAVALVSPTPGTTTDPVEKPMELLPFGPVVLIDTAGIDDEGDLGAQRVARSQQVIERVDLAVLVVGATGWGPPEEKLHERLAACGAGLVVVFNQADLAPPEAARMAILAAAGVAVVATVATTGQGVPELRAALLQVAPEATLRAPALLGDLLPPGGLAVLVVPIDMEAPKGRLILPQVQAIRDLLDHDQMALVVKERELAPALARLAQPPDLVVTDSQAFLKVAADTPDSVPLTSFSVLMARAKGDLDELVRGTAAIDRLRSGSCVMISEACSHHPQGDDIGRVKIPRWLRQYVGAELAFEWCSGRDFPDNLANYDLVVHCGGCALGRREMLARLARCRAAGVPITNYGLTIATALGIVERALSPFPAARETWHREHRTPRLGA